MQKMQKDAKRKIQKRMLKKIQKRMLKMQSVADDLEEVHQAKGLEERRTGERKRAIRRIEGN